MSPQTEGEIVMKVYVIVKCTELNDQYECDADRTPILVLTKTNSDGLKKFQRYGYEIYVTSRDGSLRRIQEYNDYE